MHDEVELAILGGGLAGQCLARHLRRAGVEGRIVIVERGPLPIPPTTLKLGESTVEAGAWYLGHRLGLHERLVADHEMKFGLRFFFSAGNNADLGRRLELGPIHAVDFRRGLRPPAYQLHRGRLEHMLALDNRELGVELWGGCEVEHVELAAAGERARHRVELREGAHARVLRPRWVVDASGRAGLIADRLGLRRRLGHRVRVAHGWVPRRIDPEAWTRDSGFVGRLEAGLRWRSTVHLMGPGYSIWLIPVGAKLSSVGVVSHSPGGALEEVRDEAALETWLADREPQLAAVIAEAGWVEGPRFGEVEAQLTRTVVSPRRFAVCGEAAAHIDPLYSSGIDLLAIANELIVATVLDERRGRALEAICARRNASFATVARELLRVYADAYRLLDAPRIATHKISWDVAIYLGAVAPLVMAGTFAAAEPFVEQLQLAARVVRLNDEMQALFGDWRTRGGALEHPVAAVNFATVPPVGTCFRRLGDLDLDAGPEAWQALLEANLAELEIQAQATALDAAADLGLAAPVDARTLHGLGLDARVWGAGGPLARAQDEDVSVAATREELAGGS